MQPVERLLCKAAAAKPLIERTVNLRNLTKQDVIAAAWEALDCPSVGAKELEQVRNELARVFGYSDSPASIARVLADEGAELRHPEILEFDTRWREQAMSVDQPFRLDFGSLEAALESIATLQELRDSDQETTKALHAHVLAAKADCLQRAASSLLEDRERAEAKEIANWLGVWLNTPKLFDDWLELRRLSPQFLKKFEGF